MLSFQIVSIDIIGQFMSSDRGHVFLAVIIDMLTKYTIAVPLRDTTAPDITQAIQTAVYQQGPPRKFVSDQHEEFIKEVLKHHLWRGHFVYRYSFQIPVLDCVLLFGDIYYPACCRYLLVPVLSLTSLSLCYQLNMALELDTGLVGNVVAVNKTQINRPDEAAIKTSILQHCIETGSTWEDALQKKVRINYYSPFCEK